MSKITWRVMEGTPGQMPDDERVFADVSEARATWKDMVDTYLEACALVYGADIEPRTVIYDDKSMMFKFNYGDDWWPHDEICWQIWAEKGCASCSR